MSEKKAGIANLGAEETERMLHTVLTREDTKQQAEALFNSSKDARKRDVALLEKLFLQAPASQSMSHNLLKVAAAEQGKMNEVREMEKVAAAKSTLDFFEKKAYLTEAQRRFPELLSVINPKVIKSEE